MSAIDHLLTVAEAYAAAEDIPLQTVSSRVFDDGKKLNAIKDGSDIHTRRCERAMVWFSENWPARTAWPKGIKRPAPTEGSNACT